MNVNTVCKSYKPNLVGYWTAPKMELISFIELRVAIYWIFLNMAFLEINPFFPLLLIHRELILERMETFLKNSNFNLREANGV